MWWSYGVYIHLMCYSSTYVPTLNLFYYMRIMLESRTRKIKLSKSNVMYFGQLWINDHKYDNITRARVNWPHVSWYIGSRSLLLILKMWLPYDYAMNTGKNVERTKMRIYFRHNLQHAVPLTFTKNYINRLKVWVALFVEKSISLCFQRSTYP